MSANTLDLFGKVMPCLQADAAEQVDAAIRRTVQAGAKAFGSGSGNGRIELTISQVRNADDI